MQVIKSPEAMRALSVNYQKRDLTLGFVPTMGALHDGHLSLVERSRKDNDVTVVSIFVNPTQFGPDEDFNRYPRDSEGDPAKLGKAGVDIVFMPDHKELYPDGYRSYVIVEEISDLLCGAFRPGHFRGVATIVTKLFNIVMPVRAYFGQKDYQQTAVIKRLVRDLNMGVEVVVCPVIREADGLAMSSRNSYLSSEERKAAAVIYRSLKEVSERLKGRASFDIPGEIRRLLSSEPLVSEIQYAGAFDPVTLKEVDCATMRGRVLLAVAVRIGATRLIDNVIVENK